MKIRLRRSNKSDSAQQKKSAGRILIIDDDPVIVKMLEGRLAANGFDPLVANEAPIGLEMAIKKNPDLIILDVMMPIINGYNMCSLLKAEEKTKKIPIIMLTARSEEIDKNIGEKVGVDAYLTKPFLIDDLLAAIRKLIKV